MLCTRARAAASLLALTAGCQDYLFEQKCPEAITEAQQSVAVAEPRPVDILFVVDNSGSMADEQQNLVRNFGAFIDVLAGSALDYRIAVVSTDLGNDPNRIRGGDEVEGIAGFDVNEASPYRPVDTNDRSDCRTVPAGTQHGCFRSSRAEPWIDSTRDAPETIISTFQASALVGTCGSGLERGTGAMLESLRNTRAGGCNAGFMREEANLVVVFVTDEDDFGAAPPAELLRQLGELKPLDRVRVALIGGVVDGMPSTCRTGANGEAVAMCGSLCDMSRPELVDQGPCGRNGACPQYFECTEVSNRARCVNVGYINWPNLGTGFGCDSCSSYDVDTCCAADTGGADYYAFATALEAEVARLDPDIGASGCAGAADVGRPACLVDSICQAEFASTLERIARDLVVSTTIELSRPASYPPGVVVRITGGRFAAAPNELVNCASPGANPDDCDFSVNAAGTAIELRSADILPRADESLDVFFTVDNPLDTPRVGACADTSTTAP